MSLWDIIRNFFVQHIFGGTDTDLISWGGFIGNLYNKNTNDGIEGYAYDLSFKLNNSYVQYFNDADLYISIGDWLSTTFTIITLIALCFFLFLVVRWLFRLTAGLIQGRG